MADLNTLARFAEQIANEFETIPKREEHFQTINTQLSPETERLISGLAWQLRYVSDQVDKHLKETYPLYYRHDYQYGNNVVSDVEDKLHHIVNSTNKGYGRGYGARPEDREALERLHAAYKRCLTPYPPLRLSVAFFVKGE